MDDISWLEQNVQPELLSSKLFKFEIVGLSCGPIGCDLTTDLHIDYENLESLLQTTPAQYVFWSAVYSELRSEIAVVEERMARRRAYLGRYIIDKFKAEGVKLTDKQFAVLVENDSVDTDQIAADVAAANKDKTTTELIPLISNAIEEAKKRTINYMKARHIVLNKQAGKAFNMMRAVEMKSEHLRSLSGFKRMDKEQTRTMT